MSEKKIMGYARVSSRGQNLERQIMELKKYVPEENIVVDKASGKDLERPGYQALKGPLGLRQGDELVIKSLDRLSRNKAEIKRELEWFRDHDIVLRILDMPTTLLELGQEQKWIQEMVDNIIIEVMASLAEQERVQIRQRQREGIEAAKKKGKHLGRPRVELPENWEKIVDDWKEHKITAREAAGQLKMSKTTFYRLIRCNS